MLSSRQSLWRHKQKCRDGRVRASPISYLLMSPKESTKPVNSPKIRALIDEIINDDQDMDDVTSQPSFEVKQNSSPDISREISQNASAFPSKESLVPPKPSVGVIAEVFQDEVLPNPSPEIVAAVFQEEPSFAEQGESSSRTKGDTIGFSED